MKKIIKSILVLVSICAVVSTLLACVNYITAPIIKDAENKKSNAALLEVLPEGKSFELVPMGDYTLPETVKEVYKSEGVGYVFKLSTTGYATGLVFMCGVSADGKVVGTKIITSSETPAIGGAALDTVAPNTVGKTLEDIDGVDTVAGATYSTAAFKNAVKDALNAAVILGGGSVELRTEEEIFRDNLNAALPEAEGEFEKHFFLEVVEGVDAIYTAKNGKGAVCVIGESFIAVDADGRALGDVAAEDKQTVETAMAIIKATEKTAVDLTAFEGIATGVTSVEKTATGNYIIELKANGYAMGVKDKNGQNHFSYSGLPKVPIVIRVSMTAEGKIIDCITVSQGESPKFGDACANESFYGQFDGKTEENYNDIDAISGATVTTEAYKKAILEAFKTVNIIEGGNEQQ